MNPPSNNPSSHPSAEQNSHDTEELWTTPQVAKFLHVSRKSVYELRKRGLPYLKLGGAVRYIPQEIRQYLQNSRRLSSHRLRQIARTGAAA